MTACLLNNQQDWSINIPHVIDEESFTLYLIEVRVGLVTWTVKHRYREFSTLHSDLVREHGITKDLLPPKKLIKNRDPAFVESRRVDLQKYLNTVFRLLLRNMPQQLAWFLEFDKYDIMFLLQRIGQKLSKKGVIHKPSHNHELDLIQVHAISERLKLPCPPLDMIGFQHDFSIILDFCSIITTLTIRGRSRFEGTNIVPNSLKFDLLPFKVLTHLKLKNVPPENLVRADELRVSLTKLDVRHCNVGCLSEILLCDTVHKEAREPLSDKNWKVTSVDFSHNSLITIDDYALLMPNVEVLNLSSNRIETASNLSDLTHLAHLNLSNNNIYKIDDLNVNLPNLTHIDLSENQIRSLKGLDRLVGLESFNLASNKIASLDEINYIKDLPKLRRIVLTGNPVSTVVDYRVKVLERFAERAPNVCLDNEQPTQHELDVVAVLVTLRCVKEGRTQICKELTKTKP